MRNFWPSYRGPAYSRAGSAFVGFSKQTGAAHPPRMVPFQFSVGQGLALEIGHLYMRVIYDGAFVTEGPVTITGISQANPAVVSAVASGVTGAIANNAAVTSSYAPGDIVTLAGGTYGAPARLNVLQTTLLSLAPQNPGTGYVPGDTINLAGGTQATPPVVTVVTTQVVSATIDAAGTGGTNGLQTVTGTSGTGDFFTALVQIGPTETGGSGSGTITAVQSITYGGAYTVNPSSLTAAPVSGASLTGAKLTIVMGVQSVTVATAGAFTANPNSGAFTQNTTSGAGIGATFNQTIFGILLMGVTSGGNYSVFPTNPAAQLVTTGSGVGATFTLTTGSVQPFANGDWVYLAGIAGPSSLNGETVIVANATPTTFQMTDVYGNVISAATLPAYIAGGTASRIYTLTTPWAAKDLPYLKYTQSADVMSICCVNTATATEYAPQDLERITDSLWALTAIIPDPTIVPPTGVSGTASTTGAVDYQYQVTAIADDGTESIASNIASIGGAVDIGLTAGTITLSWSPSPGAENGYYVYKASPGYNATPPVGSLFGFAGQALGTQFIDPNIVQDLAQVPPTHYNPFAPGQIFNVVPGAAGSGYTYAKGYVTSATGSGAVLIGVVSNGGVVAWVVQDSGRNYQPTDTLIVAGDGAGATGTLTVGPQSGNYPSVPAYFQQRRVYANSLNYPDTYWMSQPGSYTNFDARNPTIASDAITGTPWGTQVNGIQWMVLTSGGLLVMTGLSAWLLAGVGSFATNVQPISPSTQDAVPQAFSGCSALVPPVRVNYDVIYVEAKDSRVYDLPYQLYSLSEPIDLTEISPHLFQGYTISQIAWCEQPSKLYWAVRNDGVLLSMTYYKTQQISGWSRHDTNGLFVSCCSVIEPPVDALYLATQRFPNGNNAYMIERMDNRIWPTAESSWCVDAGLQLAMPTPAATLTVSSVYGLGAITGVAPGSLVGGAGYSPGTTASVTDLALNANGTPIGSGAVPTLTIVNGVITAITFSGGNQGASYQQPQLIFNDPAGSQGGSGASATLVLSNTATCTASAPVFAPNAAGDVIRAGGGVAVVTQVSSTTQVTVNILNPFQPPPNSGTLQPFASGAWTLTTPVTTVGGLTHLIGETVTGLADGNVIPAQVVNSLGQITLSTPATYVTVGLGFQAQMQDVPLDAGNPTVQAQRKKISNVSVRLEASRGVKVGVNQPDGSTLSPAQLAPIWGQLQTVPDTGPDAQNFPLKPYNALCIPLRTGDVRVNTEGGWATPGQVCVQQDNPLPCQIAAIVVEMLPGDTPQLQAQKKQPQGKGQ